MTIPQTLEMPDFKIVDFHLHLPVKQDDWLRPYRERFVAAYGQERWNQRQSMNANVPSWLPEYCFPTPEEPGEDYAVAAKRWRQECETFNLERVVFQTGGGNEALAAIVNQNSDVFTGFAHHYIGDANAAETLEYAIKTLKLSGYKILAPVVEKPLNSPEYADVFELCHQMRLPVLVHFGILGGAGGVVSGSNMSPLALADVAARYPHAHFIVPHFGCGYTNDLLQLCWACPNVMVDTSGNNLWTKWTMENYTLEQLFSRFYATIGAGRILFGSDSEWFPRGFAVRYMMDQLRAVYGIGMPKADIQRIFRENALELLQL